jgi:hypothetical protein
VGRVARERVLSADRARGVSRDGRRFDASPALAPKPYQPPDTPGGEDQRDRS